MELDERLLWVQRNRWRTAQTVQLGPLVQRLIKQVCAPDPLARVAHAADVLAGVVDEEFRNHCRIAGIKQGTLIVHVDHPGIVYALRGRWRVSLLEALGTIRGRAAIQQVIFRFGSDGWRIGPTKGASRGAG